MQCKIKLRASSRVQARHLKLGDVLFRFSCFREKFQPGFHFCLYILYILTSLSAEKRETFEPVGRLSLPHLPLAYSLIKNISTVFLQL